MSLSPFVDMCAFTLANVLVANLNLASLSEEYLSASSLAEQVNILHLAWENGYDDSFFVDSCALAHGILLFWTVLKSKLWDDYRTRGSNYIALAFGDLPEKPGKIVRLPPTNDFAITNMCSRDEKLARIRNIRDELLHRKNYAPSTCQKLSEICCPKLFCEYVISCGNMKKQLSVLSTSYSSSSTSSSSASSTSETSSNLETHVAEVIANVRKEVIQISANHYQHGPTSSLLDVSPPFEVRLSNAMQDAPYLFHILNEIIKSDHFKMNDSSVRNKSERLLLIQEEMKETGDSVTLDQLERFVGPQKKRKLSIDTEHENECESIAYIFQKEIVAHGDAKYRHEKSTAHKKHSALVLLEMICKLYGGGNIQPPTTMDLAVILCTGGISKAPFQILSEMIGLPSWKKTKEYETIMIKDSKSRNEIEMRPKQGFILNYT